MTFSNDRELIRKIENTFDGYELREIRVLINANLSDIKTKVYVQTHGLRFLDAIVKDSCDVLTSYLNGKVRVGDSRKYVEFFQNRVDVAEELKELLLKRTSSHGAKF
ncbi:sulfite reductase, dissimilatory-type beta subunit [Pectobacterium phage POP12]|nr:sulfite reductase, dissimilatory-type beta subunit [Pectobacterium phage POP12]